MNNTELTPEQIAELLRRIKAELPIHPEYQVTCLLMTQDLKEVITAINQLTEQVAGLREDIEGYVQANTDLLAKIDALRGDKLMKTKLSSLSDGNRVIEQMQSRIKELKAEQKNTLILLARETAKVEDLRTENAGWNKACMRCGDENAALQSEVARLTQLLKGEK